jgi:SpoVK/Ycf46/Vps4 family AAA+-type ATPase
MENRPNTAVPEESENRIVESSSTALAEVKYPSEATVIVTSNAPEITPIAELRPTSYDKIIEVRVYRKWVLVSYGKKTRVDSLPRKLKLRFAVS